VTRGVCRFHQIHNLATSSGEVVLCGGSARIEQENCGGRIGAFTVTVVDPFSKRGDASSVAIGRQAHGAQ
jgi:hypothetical protein